MLTIVTHLDNDSQRSNRNKLHVSKMTFLSQIIVIFSFKLLKCNNITDSFSVENLIVGNTTYSDNVSWSIPEETFISNITESPFDNNTTAINLSWLTNAIRDVAYYLRAHKFNEYDRRYEKKPKNPGKINKVLF